MNTKIIKGLDFINFINEVFELPSNTKSIEIHADIKGIVTVKAEYYPEIKDDNTLSNFIKARSVS